MAWFDILSCHLNATKQCENQDPFSTQLIVPCRCFDKVYNAIRSKLANPVIKILFHGKNLGHSPDNYKGVTENWECSKSHVLVGIPIIWDLAPPLKVTHTPFDNYPAHIFDHTHWPWQLSKSKILSKEHGIKLKVSNDLDDAVQRLVSLRPEWQLYPLVNRALMGPLLLRPISHKGS